MWFVKEGLEAKQELSKYQVVGLRSAAPGEKGEKKPKSLNWRLEKQLNQGHYYVEFI